MSTDLGRNDPCHCGSKKKYKKCHLEKDEMNDKKKRDKLALKAAKAAEKESKKEGPAPLPKNQDIKKRIGFKKQPAKSESSRNSLNEKPRPPTKGGRVISG